MDKRELLELKVLGIVFVSVIAIWFGGKSYLDYKEKCEYEKKMEMEQKIRESNISIGYYNDEDRRKWKYNYGKNK